MFRIVKFVLCGMKKQNPVTWKVPVSTVIVYTGFDS